MPAKYGEEKRQALCEAYRRTGSAPQAAKAVGVSTAWAYRVLKARGIFESSAPDYSEEMAEEACRLYVEEELPLVSVCEHLEDQFGKKPSDTWVMCKMDERGIERRDAGYKRNGVEHLRYNGRRLRLRGPYGAEKVRHILDDYQDGDPPRVLSDRYDAPVSTIEKWTKRAGVQRNSSEARCNYLIRNGRMSPVAAAHIAERLCVEEEMPIEAVAEELDVTTATVIDYLDKRGVERRSRSESLRIHKYGSLDAYRQFCQKVARLWHAEDWTKKAICDELDISYPTLNRALATEHNPFRENRRDRSWVEKAGDTPTSRSNSRTRRKVPSVS